MYCRVCEAVQNVYTADVQSTKSRLIQKHCSCCTRKHTGYKWHHGLVYVCLCCLIQHVQLSLPVYHS